MVKAASRKKKVYEGIKIVKEHDIDFILAVGGGSTIDCSKAIAAGSKTDEDFWKKYFINKDEVLDATPLGSVLTMAGTGSEMDNGGVITNWEEQLKLSFGGDPCYPKFSILDPTYTYSLEYYRRNKRSTYENHNRKYLYSLR